MTHAAIVTVLWVVLSFGLVAAWIACCEVVRRIDRRHARESVVAELGPMPEPGMPDGVTWPGDCPACVWWIPAPSEAEDATAVYRPCPVHDPALWAELERRVTP